MMQDDDDDDDDNNTVTSTLSATSNPAPLFAVDEKVYCYDKDAGGTYYEAIVREQKYEASTRTWTFLVHYAGWNSRWDRWVGGANCASNNTILLKDTEESRAKYAAAPGGKNNKRARPSSSSSSPPVSTLNASSSSSSSGSKNNNNRKRLMVRSNTSAARSMPQPLVYEDFCELPFTLKTVLVDECEKIANPPPASGAPSSNNNDSCHNKPHRLVHCLPAPVTVRKVISHFEKKKLKECAKAAAAAKAGGGGGETADAAATPPPTSRLTVETVQEFCKGLTQLFQDAVPFCLLYPQERPQYENLASKKDLVDVYGCEFLLRLYVRLPILLQQHAAAAGTERWSPQVVGPLLTDLLVLMQKNRLQLFPSTITSSTSTAAAAAAATETSSTANYRPPTREEYMDWEKRLYNGGLAGTPKSSPVVKMDTC